MTTITISQNYKELEQNVAEGLDFILYHLKEPIWPRTISTKATEGRQILAYNKQEALAWYKAANILDCRISAYPPSYGYAAIQLIDLVMIDLDQSKFKSSQALDRTLSKTIRNIKETFGIEFEPTEIWSGNGYHIYIPIESRYVLEERPEFNKYEESSKQFLRFVEWYLSDGKSDPTHNKTVSFGNCMLRIPGSHNSRCVQRNNGMSDFTTAVKIINKWNGYRAPAYLLIGSFLSYLVDQKLKEIKLQRQSSKYRHEDNNKPSIKTTTIPWIETLLQTPLSDHRKYIIFRILPRYLINIKRLDYDAFNVINDWLYKCKSLRRLDSNFDSRIKDNLNYAIKSGRLPISLDTLKLENKELYDIIVSRRLE